jgi:hypothetical protein
MDCEFLETRLDDINFEGAILSNLEIKDLTVLNLNFTDTFTTKFYKSNSNEGIEVKSQSNFEKIWKDMDGISSDEDEMDTVRTLDTFLGEKMLIPSTFKVLIITR